MEYVKRFPPDAGEDQERPTGKARWKFRVISDRDSIRKQLNWRFQLIDKPQKKNQAKHRKIGDL